MPDLPDEDFLDLDDEEPDEDDRPAFRAAVTAEEAIAAVRADLAAGAAVLAGARSDELSPEAPPLPPALSEDWLVLGWTRMVGAPDAEDHARLADSARLIDVGLQQPGLLGVAAALHALHRPGLWPEPEAPELRGLDVPGREERAAWERGDLVMAARLRLEREKSAEKIRQEAAESHQGISPAWGLCRLIAPWLIQRACALPFPSRARGYQRHWCVWCGANTRRSPSFHPRCGAGDSAGRWPMASTSNATGWTSCTGSLALGKGGCPSGRARVAEKTKATLRLLIERPALDSATLARRRGIRRRMAQVLLHDLERAGIVTETTGRYSERVWFAPGIG